MHTVTRVFSRLTLASLCALSLTLAAAGTAAAVNVDLRIEGATATLANTALDTGPRSVSRADSSCVADGGFVPSASATPSTAAADWAQSAGSTALVQDAGWGVFLCGLGGETGDATGGWWLVKINNKTQDPPGTYLTGSTTLNEGDKVLWYRDAAWPPAPTLDLVLPPKVGVGQSVTGRVDSYNSETDAASAGAGASIGGGGATATAGADGGFSVTFPTAGKHLVTAALAGSIRGSAVVEVVSEAVTPAPIDPPQRASANRFKRCNAKYGKGSPTHRRCIKIVRAKQQKECRKAAARNNAVCRKLARRSR